MRLLPCGERAVLVELDSLPLVIAAEAVLRALRDRGGPPWDRVVDVVPAARSVLVSYRWGDLRDEIASALDGLAPALPQAAATLSIDVTYNGPDLANVAQATGLSEAEVIEAHTGTPWRVAFGGFAPGFAYLTGGDERLRVPRHASPRQRVPAGSVALADEFSGIYPSSSPGGWQIIGRTNAVLFDPARTPPALLRPGTQVKFRAVGRSTPARTAPAAASATRPSRGLSVVHTLMPILVQDRGRPGLAAIGVGCSGAADRAAYELGARLVGNEHGEAALEIVLGSCALRSSAVMTIALTGAPCEAHIDGLVLAWNTPLVLPQGAVLTLGSARQGLRTYLSVRGGIDAAAVLGSRSTDQLAGLGPAPLTAGDVAPVGSAPPGGAAADWAPTTWPGEVVLTYLPGPRADWVDGLDTSTWMVSSAVDRVGVRLIGDALRRRPGELLSEPVTRGAIQVPPNGQAVIFLADHPLTGGYPVAGVLDEASADMAAQLRPGQRITLRAQ